MPSIPTNSPRLHGHATPQGTSRYAARFQGQIAAGHFRQAAGGAFFSSVGIGTYLGEPDAATDRAYTHAVVAAVEAGFNVIDTAINYRFQRSERCVGQALKLLAAQGFSREEIILCTKAGFLTPDGEMPEDAADYFSREYVDRGILRPEEIAAGCHAMSPHFLADQLERSLKNMGVETVDIFYLHNPETQLGEVPPGEFLRRVREAFVFLESAVARGKVAAYGMATWNAFREESKSPGYLSLAEMEAIARDAGGADHHFRAVQLPLNLAMPEALLRANQVVQGKTLAMVQAARALGITLVTSASLLQGQLARKLPPYVRETLGAKTDAGNALQFARSVPGATTALVGMSQEEHVRANAEVTLIEPAPRDQFLKLFQAR